MKEWIISFVISIAVMGIIALWIWGLMSYEIVGIISLISIGIALFGVILVGIKLIIFDWMRLKSRIFFIKFWTWVVGDLSQKFKILHPLLLPHSRANWDISSYTKL